MNYFNAGQFLGQNKQTILFEDITITETEYDYKFIDWHYHEYPYFSFVTMGSCCDSNKRETFACATDSLLFHNHQEPHYNTKSDGVSRGFQLELSPEWGKKFALDLDRLPRSSQIINPSIKLLFYNIYKEAKLPDDTSNLTIDSLLLQIFDNMRGVENLSLSVTPHWVKKIDEILRENFDQPLSLQSLSAELNLHWAHLSRDFPRYFRCTFSQYVRKIKVEKSLALLRQPHLSLAEIAFTCAFADQSHFIRCFRECTGITPKEFRKLI